MTTKAARGLHLHAPEGAPDIVSLESLRFEDLDDGRTRLAGRSVFPSLEARDAMAGSGMEWGMTQIYERLEALLRGGT